MTNRLLENADRIHASEMAAQRLRANLELVRMDPVTWVREAVLDPGAEITLKGRKWHVHWQDTLITIRDGTFAIDTGQKKRSRHGTVEPLKMPFAICSLKDFSRVDPTQPFCFTACTDQEHSLICPQDRIPDNALEHSGPWRCFRVRQTMDLDLVDNFAKMTRLLVGNGIGVFSTSTFNTDYVFVPENQWDKARAMLEQHHFLPGDPAES